MPEQQASEESEEGERGERGGQARRASEEGERGGQASRARRASEGDVPRAVNQGKYVRSVKMLLHVQLDMYIEKYQVMSCCKDKQVDLKVSTTCCLQCVHCSLKYVFDNEWCT